ncbi:MAG: Integral rane sensor signal transduction histidine kinase [Pedosphaera sp.]|nr:Integral rane sensor signal transduction histidine kinase [Pedosphaera sp.]
MKPFRDLPIQRKMLVMTLLICGAVLCVAISALFLFQVLNFRSNFQRDTATLAVIMANQSTAAMSYKDEQTANEVVGSLKAKPTVLAASLVLPDGTALAHFGQAEDARSRSQFPPAGQQRFTGGQLLVTQPITLRGERVGTLFLRSDYQRTFLELLGFYGLVVLAITLVSIGLAVFLSSRLGRGITQPILDLARTAQIVGELKDYSVRATVNSQGDELGRLSESFNEMLSRIQSQAAALNLSQQKMETLIHSIDGIVWERTPDTFRFTFVSRQSQDILGYPPEAWLEKSNFWEEKLQPQDAAKATQTARDMATRGQPYTYEYRMIAASGQTVWIRESGTVLMENEQPVAVRGIFQDITRQKLDAAQLDKLNQQLMGTSRLAGMAEVATGVLHNVGNVLNSVSVSATLVADGLRRSKVVNLHRATTLLREQNGRLAEFLTSDPKGKVIPEYIATLADQLTAEQARMIEKMDSVGKNIEHIKEIVAMQQSYAKVSGVYENLQVEGLIEDALRMNTAAFDRHHIDLVRDFAENLPPVCVDRHKVLQILINLLRNAKHSMTAHGGDELKMTIRVALASPERVKISIADTGLGIAPELLTKVFNHGFTTKKDGHGFGLHSGANAAKEMGGTLSAHSEGLGKGAVFTLELPASVSNRQPNPLAEGKREK